MLPIKNRLKKREDFSTVFAKGSYATTGNLSIKYAASGLDSSRIGFPIGKNYSKKAVTRNHTRRILRAACVQIMPELKSGFDIIVLIKPSYQNVEFEKIVLELRKNFQKANLLT